jgi:phosphomannomutase
MLYKIWAFHGGYYEECRLLEYKNTVRTSQKTHYVSATESSPLMLYKIWAFHGGDYEECLLGYKNPGHTLQKTHYMSSTESNLLI